MDLIIVGAGGMGREIYAWLSQEIKGKPDHRIIGFIDDNLEALNNYSYPVKIIGDIASYQPKANESLVIAIMEPSIKKNIVTNLGAKGAKFYTLIHPSVITGFNIKIGKGCVIAPRCIITTDVSIGDFVFLNINASVGHDVTIGNYTSINGKTEITGKVSVGEECFFGTSTSIIPSRRIGDRAKIGAGSVVIGHVAENTTVFGNPAKKIT